MNSSADGVTPVINIDDTAAQASSFVLNEASITRFWLTTGINFKTILVIIPSVPSEPIINCVRL
jgi:hypothetical protein